MNKIVFGISALFLSCNALAWPGNMPKLNIDYPCGNMAFKQLMQGKYGQVWGFDISSMREDCLLDRFTNQICDQTIKTLVSYLQQGNESYCTPLTQRGKIVHSCAGYEIYETGSTLQANKDICRVIFLGNFDYPVHSTTGGNMGNGYPINGAWDQTRDQIKASLQQKEQVLMRSIIAPISASELAIGKKMIETINQAVKDTYTFAEEMTSMTIEACSPEKREQAAERLKEALSEMKACMLGAANKPAVQECVNIFTKAHNERVGGFACSF